MKTKRILAMLLSVLMLLSLLPVSALAADTARTRSVTFDPASLSAASPLPEVDLEPTVETVGDPVRVPLTREIPDTLVTPASEPAAEEAPEPVRAETHRVGWTTSEAADARRPADAEPAAFGNPCTVSLFIQPSLDAGNLMVYPSGAHYVGQTIILIAVPKSGYHFVAWVNYETEEVSYNSQYSTVLQGDCEWDALFIRDGEYSIYRNKPLDMEVSPNLYSYIPGTEVTLMAPPKDGRSIVYEIGEETDDHTAASVTWQRIGSDGKFSMPAANTWVRGLYSNNINVSCSGHGTAVLSPEGPYYEGDTVTLTLEPEAGYYASHVTGLPVGYSVSENVITFQTDYDANINIEFLPIPAASVNFGVFPSGKGTLNHSLNEETGVITAEAIPADGFTLLYWMKYDQSTGACQALSAENPYVFVPQEDMLVVAVFGFLYPAEGGAVQTVIADNGDVTMTAVPAPGYQFLFWMSIADQEIISYDAAYTTLPRVDIALAAAFQKGTRRVIPADYQPERGSFQVVNNQYYFNPGDTVALEAVPAEGYALETFLMAEYQEGVTSYQMTPVSGSSFVMPDYDVVVTAAFCHLYTVSTEASPLEGGFALGGGQYKEGQAVTLTAVPNEGWRFVNWTENGSAVSTDAEYSFTASADRSLTANFELIPTTYYTVSASANPTEGGNVSGAGEYAEGETVTLTAVPNEGWRFLNWTENGDTVSTNAAYSFTASADRSLTANFEQIPVTYYTISASANPTEGGTVTGAGQYAEAATVTLTAVPNEGWHFLNWTENGSVVSTSPIYGFIAVTNRSLTANFEPFTGESVSYLDPTDEANPNKICEDYTLLTNQNALGTGWYVVNQDVAIYGGITVLGNVHIILCDGATLTSAQGIRVTEGTSLTLWAQSEGDGMGVLFAGTTDGANVTCHNIAGIGGQFHESCGTVTINGGTVTAYGSSSSAGIGGGQGGNGGTVTVNGGTVTATGDTSAAGIGGGFEGSGGTVTVNGGTVTTAGGTSAAGIGGGFEGSGGTVTVNGGTVTTAGGMAAAGIGGGHGGNGGTVTVNGGTVTATGGRDGAGIGGAQGKNGGTITISGGTVTATGGGDGAGIGNGQGGKGGTITISGGMVTATSSGDMCVGIGSGTVTISSGTVTATGGEYGAGISGNTVAISGGTVTATGGEYGAGISSVLMGNGGTVTITGGSVTAIAGTYGQAIAHGQSSGEDSSLTIDGMKVYASEEATEPVAAADRMETCHSPWARLERCNPHCCDENNFCIWCGAAGPVAYLDPTDEANPNKICEDYTLLTNQTALESGWYVVSSNVVISERITVSGDVKIILVDGCTLTAPKGVNVEAGNSFTIYGQDTPYTAPGATEATLGTGALIVSETDDYIAGIGGAQGKNGGTITISGGTVTATGGRFGAGIGGGRQGAGGKITINGGSVTATGGFNGGAGIGGGGEDGAAGEIMINGGTVTAQSGGNGGAGIGSGDHGASGKITVNGGIVSATGGNDAAGIGGGACSAGGIITINDGTVTANGGRYGAGIGGGLNNTGAIFWYDASGEITVNGGTVTATGGTGAAGIGGGISGAGGTVTINGGTVVAGSGDNLEYVSGEAAQAIGHGKNDSDSGTLDIPCMKVYASEEAAEPVAAVDRIDTCRSSWAKLTPCEPHNNYYVDNGETHTAVCAWCGVEGEPVSHSYGEASYTWEPDGSACSAAHSCTLCQHEQTEAGSVSAQVILQPTCTEYGKTSYTAVFTTQGFETQTLILTNVEPLGHDLIHHDAQAPTCTEIGWEAYDACSRCDYSTYAEIQALGHDLIHHDAQAPTCTEIGWEAYDTCSRCDYSTYAEIPALGHDLIHHDAQAPSCTEIGWEAYDTCSRCDYTTYAGLDALGHVWEVQDYVWSEDFTTCTATAVCARDGSHVQTETVNAVFVLTKPSTFESTGTGYYAAAFENELFETQTQEVIVPEVACAGGETCPSGHFTDLPPITSYAHIPIDWAVVNRITGGTSPTTFGPEQSCTRAQFVMFLWCVMGRPEPAAENNPFRDVKPSDYFYKAVLWAVENGITAGTSADTFSPKMAVTRAQVVTFIWHNEGDQTASRTENPFEDVRDSDYFHDAVLWAVENGITAGTSATTFSPSAICTRAQCMTFLYRKFGQ